MKIICPFNVELNEKRKEILPIKVILRIVTSLPIILVGKGLIRKAATD